MVPGENPQYSKAADEPLTVDLTAERINDADAKESIEVPETESSMTGPARTEDFKAPQESSSFDSGTAEASREAGTTEIDENISAAPASAPTLQKKTGTTSGSIAAGIFGGLVALIGAGSVQYAGLIPSLAPVETVAPAGPDYAAEIETLKSQLATLAAVPVAGTPDLAPFESRMAALETSLASIAANSGSADGAGNVNSEALTAMSQRLAKLEMELAAAKAGLAEAEKKIDAPKTEINVGRAIATSALKAAIDRGGPFVSELETLTNVAPDDAAIGKLQPFAKNGVLSRAQLLKQMPDVADAILNTINQPAEGTGLTERLVQSALSVIKVRPVGDVEGEGPAAIVARMEERLQNGDLKGSAEQWDTLPSDAKEVSKDFKTSLDTRITVEGLIGDAMSDAVAGSAIKG